MIAWLPKLPHKSQFFSRPIGKAAFDELQGSLQCFRRGYEQMKVVGHHHKFVQEVSLLLTVVQENIHKQLCHPAGLEQVPLLKRRSGDEVTAIPSIPAMWGGHRSPQRLKPFFNRVHSIAAVKPLRHPKAKNFAMLSNLGLPAVFPGIYSQAWGLISQTRCPHHFFRIPASIV